MGTQKNRLNETVLFSTQNMCFNLWVRKEIQFMLNTFSYLCRCLSYSVCSVTLMEINAILGAQTILIWAYEPLKNNYYLHAFWIMLGIRFSPLSFCLFPFVFECSHPHCGHFPKIICKIVPFLPDSLVTPSVPMDLKHNGALSSNFG